MTLRDIAAAAGVSITTVSLVLNNHPTRVSPEKRELIKRKAQELHYIPNQTARSLVTHKSMLLALLVPDIENLFFASLAKEIEDACSTDNYSLIIANSNDSKTTERQLLQQFEARNIDGLFLIPSGESTKDSTDLKDEVAQMSCPVVLTDRLVREHWCDAVGSDNYKGGQLAARLFIKAGHTHIACISGRHDNGNAEARKAGFVDELGKNDIFISPNSTAMALIVSMEVIRQPTASSIPEPQPCSAATTSWHWDSRNEPKNVACLFPKIFL
ncbi:LacI family DNA-binding transcriptional regulator [Bifidobacterium sp. ESL0682]|uniref:LacI family DNA-binding transcriptional regulator n=1 Tax=Bifidobacterium sp. ESL0682 TaxID=2983212 RepID=UPI0023F95934|nr:LacI family DNA-binding transcriptional regulator [Bifidobacterium sp. ESL0682]WEV42129.1 LacI family DNA-binding transcriptional regulator [Bifidobacterium sp. ESL0682]